MLLKLSDNVTGYEVVSKILLEELLLGQDSIVVQLRTRHTEEAEWRNITTLLLCDQFDDDDARCHWVWEDDWWEGERFIDFVAAANVCDVDLGYEYAVFGEDVFATRIFNELRIHKAGQYRS